LLTYHVELHHVGRWQTAAALMPPDPQMVTWLAFSPDDRHLAVATSQDLVQLWDLRVLRERLARQNDLLKRLRGAASKPNITYLAADYRVSRRTILRDLHDLVQRGQLDPRSIQTRVRTRQGLIGPRTESRITRNACAQLRSPGLSVADADAAGHAAAGSGIGMLACHTVLSVDGS
jgi:hypothetical protein